MEEARAKAAVEARAKAAAAARGPDGADGARAAEGKREGARQLEALTAQLRRAEQELEAEAQRAAEAQQRAHASELKASRYEAMLRGVSGQLQSAGAERGQLASSLHASLRQLETANSALQSKEVLLAHMRTNSRAERRGHPCDLAQDLACLQHTLHLKGPAWNSREW